MAESFCRLKFHLWRFLCCLVSAESRTYLKAEEILSGKTFRERTHRGVVDRDFLDIALTCHSNPVFGSFALRLLELSEGLWIIQCVGVDLDRCRRGAGFDHLL